MKETSFTQAITILANIGVIAGIIFLGIEISQNTEMMQAQMAQARADSAMDQSEAIYNSAYLPEVLIAVQANQPLTPEQNYRFTAYIRAIHRNQDNILRQYHQGLLGEGTEESVRVAVLYEVAMRPAARENWVQFKTSYSEPYQALVDDVIADYLAGETAFE